MVIDCRHGLRTPNEDFCHWNPKLFGLTIRVDNFWDIWGIFGRFITIVVLWVTIPCFPLINQYFFKRLRLYIQFTNIFLGLGLEFGPQRIKGFSHRVSLVHAFGGFTSFFCAFFSFFLGCSALQTSSFRSFARHCVEINSERVEYCTIFQRIVDLEFGPWMELGLKIWVGCPEAPSILPKSGRACAPFPLTPQFCYPRCK